MGLALNPANLCIADTQDVEQQDKQVQFSIRISFFTRLLGGVSCVESKSVTRPPLLVNACLRVHSRQRTISSRLMQTLKTPLLFSLGTEGKLEGLALDLSAEWWMCLVCKERTAKFHNNR
jgi:hypothetical protein